jgi:hypothetical protein
MSLGIFLLVYAYFLVFRRIQRKCLSENREYGKFSAWCLRKCLSENREYGKFSVVCGTQNHLNKRGKNLCVHGEDAKRHKTVYPQILIIQILIFFIFFLSTLHGMDLSLKTISRYYL